MFVSKLSRVTLHHRTFPNPGSSIALKDLVYCRILQDFGLKNFPEAETDICLWFLSNFAFKFESSTALNIVLPVARAAPLLEYPVVRFTLPVFVNSHIRVALTIEELRTDCNSNTS